MVDRRTILRKGGSRSTNIGKKTEQIALMALQELQSEKKILGFKYINGAGEDFSIRKLNDTWILFEIKSSPRGAKKHRQRYITPCLVIKNNQPHPPADLRAKLVAQAKQDIIALINNK